MKARKLLGLKIYEAIFALISIMEHIQALHNYELCHPLQVKVACLSPIQLEPFHRNMYRLSLITTQLT